jgi:hypothetical protein
MLLVLLVFPPLPDPLVSFDMQGSGIGTKGHIFVFLAVTPSKERTSLTGIPRQEERENRTRKAT